MIKVQQGHIEKLIEEYQELFDTMEEIKNNNAEL